LKNKNAMAVTTAQWQWPWGLVSSPESTAFWYMLHFANADVERHTVLLLTKC